MNIRNTGYKKKADKVRNREIIAEAHRDIDEFRETKKSVSEMIKSKNHGDASEVRQAKNRAMDAINLLFGED